LAGIATLPQLLEWRIATTPTAEAYRQFDRGSGTWIGCTWSEFGARCRARRAALEAERLRRGERVAILLPNGIEHVAMDQAALAHGLVPVPMHAIDNAESIAYVLGDSEAALLILDSYERWQALAPHAAAFANLRRVVCAAMPTAAPVGDDRVEPLAQWLARAPAVMPAWAGDAGPSPSDLAAIVYTSGTTGRPKGVMLSHANIVANVKAIAARLTTLPDDILLSFLPLSHTFERTAGYYLAIAAGATVVYARSTQELAEDLKSVKPTVLISVPRIYERFHARVLAERAAASRAGRAAFDLSLAVGGRRFDARQGFPVPAPLRVLDAALWPLLNRFVADRVLAQLGGRVRIAVSGGAPIAQPVIRLFLACGLDLLQGYGMTETAPVVSTNTVEDNDPTTVGRPLDGIEVRIGEQQELLVRAPSVMVGYWRKPAETAAVLERDGWLHTGDQARIERGRIRIEGRIKDIIVTSTGEKIAPVDLENAITADPLFEQVMVVGEGRPFLAALVVLNATAWRAALAKEGLARGPEGAEAQRRFLLGRIKAAVAVFPAYATPHAVWWTTDAWTIANGLLTPTLKLKRLALERRFAEPIETLYARRN
jgi:long-chain acyl-CoA synthetase